MISARRHIQALNAQRKDSAMNEKEEAMPVKKIWSCKIGECDLARLPDGADWPMRAAVAHKYRELTGDDPQFIFSGWGGELDEGERAVVENREPSPEHYALWLKREAAPALYEALKETSEAMKTLIHEGIDRGKGHWPAWDQCARAVDRAAAALSAAKKQD